MSDVVADAAVRTSARRAQTKTRLSNAAISVFAERGIIGASVEEICDRAGFTRGAFYSNFSGKDDLVLALLRQEMDTQYTAAQQGIAAMKAAAGPERSAEELVSTALAAFDEAGRAGRDWVLTQQELLLYAARVPEVREAYQVFSDECRKQLSSLISDAVDYAGLEFRVSYPDAIELLTATHQQVLMAALLSGAPRDLRPLQVLLLCITSPRTDRDPTAGRTH